MGDDEKKRSLRMKPVYESEQKPREVPCADCGQLTTISGFAVDIVLMCNDFCKDKGWAPLKRNEVARCDGCAIVYREAQSDKARRAAALLRDLAAAIRSSHGPAAMLAAAPQWWIDEYQYDIAAELAKQGKLSSRPPDGKMKIE